MKTDGTQGTFDAILGGHSPEIREIAHGLRRIVARIHSTSVETPRSGEKCTTYGIGPRKMTQAFAYIMPFRDHVNLGFYHGAFLSDPNGILEGAGKGARHIKVKSPADVSSPAIKALIHAAVTERLIACGETSRFMKPP
jgi:hypothetical protein